MSTGELTKDQLTRALPSKTLAKYVTDDLIGLVNSEKSDHMREMFKENILGFTQVLREGKFSVGKYITATKFVSYRMLGDNNAIAYSKVFPDRYQDLVNKGVSSKDIASFASSYSRTQLVTKIFEQTLVPTHILNADLHQEAINVQAELMRGARSETVRQKAAESLIINLKAPETAKIELDVNYSNTDMVDDLRATTRALAKQQMEMIKSGVSSAKDVAHSEILAVKTEYAEVDDAS